MLRVAAGLTGLPRRSQRARSATQMVWAGLLAVVVLLGGLEFHPAAESQEPLGGLAGGHDDTYFQGASHPVQPPHAETATATQRPFCALCLNRLDGRGVRLEQAARLLSPPSAHALPAAVATSPLARSQRPDGARAPPLA
jgi:hypothetical protein